MDITTQITDVIALVKAQPNSLARNKVMSALNDARVWSKELDDKFRGLDEKPEARVTTSQSGCTCTELGIRRDCPTHGQK